MSPALAHSLVAPSDPPARWVAFLHGIYGSGGNLRALARGVIARAPGWGVVLVDLREHGRSLGFPPPHTVAAAAGDLAALEAGLPGPLAAVLGHSFGGKVALAYAAARPAPLDALVVVDATPSPRPDHRGSETVLRVLELLGRLPASFPSRAAFLAHVEGEGLTPELAQWLAMNVDRAGDAYRWKLDLDALRALLADYFALDLWPAVEDARAAARVDLVVGARSDVFDAADLSRARAVAARDPRVRVHVVPDAGHWVHVDAPEPLAAIVASALGAHRRAP